MTVSVSIIHSFRFLIDISFFCSKASIQLLQCEINNAITSILCKIYSVRKINIINIAFQIVYFHNNETTSTSKLMTLHPLFSSKR